VLEWILAESDQYFGFRFLFWQSGINILNLVFYFDGGGSIFWISFFILAE
jgi:hypothetical protein